MRFRPDVTSCMPHTHKILLPLWLSCSLFIFRAQAQVASAQPGIASKVGRVATASLLDETRRSAPVFIENRGQFPDRVNFQLSSGARTIWVTRRGIVLDLPGDATSDGPSSAPPASFDGTPQGSPKGIRSGNVTRLAVYEDFVGAKPRPEVAGKNPQPGAYNYFIGNDRSKWRTNIKGYREVVYRNLWDGIDLRLYRNGSDLEQEFVVAPGADLSRIQVSYRGAEALGVNDDGSLRIVTAFGELCESAPKVYQEIAGKRVPVKARFKLVRADTYTFEVDAYRPDYALVIDPTLLYSTYLGGTDQSQNQYASAIAVDSTGSAYVTGVTASADFPTTPGTIQPVFNIGGGDGQTFVTKFDPFGQHIVYSTFLAASAFSSGMLSQLMRRAMHMSQGW